MASLCLVVLLCGYVISAQKTFKAPPLKCPKPTYYAIAENVEPYTINAQHPNNPPDTEYWWEIVSTEGIDEDQILASGEDTDSFWIVNHDQYGEIKIKLTMEHETRSTTPCIIKLIYQPAPYFGIDLGTTFSCIAYQFPDINYHTNKRTTKIITADTSKKRQYCIPTALYFPPNKKDKLLFGYEARHQLTSDPKNVIFDVKRIIGRKWKDPEVQLFADNHLFDIMTEDEENIRIVVPNRNMMISPEQALAAILRHLVSRAVKEVDIVSDDDINVVISIPAFFNNGQRRATRSAAKLANLNAKLLVIEPTAAAIAHIYYASMPEDDAKLLLVFDYGGGTLDCSVLRCIGLECNVLAVSGNSTLGGIDFDHVIKDIIIKKLVNKYKIDRKQIDEAELLEESEKIKISLSKNDQHSFKYKAKPPVVITRKEFQNHPKTKKLLKSAIKVAKEAMNPRHSSEAPGDAINPIFSAKNIRMLLMVGGSSNLPIVQKTLRDTFTRKTLKVEFPEIDPQLMVITGSAVLAGSMRYDKRRIVEDVIPLPLGFDVCRGEYNNDKVNCGIMDIIVEKNTPYPLELNKTYCQHDPNGESVSLDLYEGENKKVMNNHFISRLHVHSLLPRAQIICNSLHAVFQIDRNGIVTIHGVAHQEDGSDGKIYTMSLSLGNNDGSLSQQKLKEMKSEMDSWFPTKKKKKKTKKKRKEKKNEEKKKDDGDDGSNSLFGLGWLFKQKQEL